MKTKFLLIILLISGLFFACPAWAKIGVGVGLGKIEAAKPLMPGGIYKLPTIVVFNTGDELADYEISVTYHHQQLQFRPPQEWFSFSPRTFTLEGGSSQAVEVRLKIPPKVTPGNYFAYLEARPIPKKRKVTVGIAAATKVYFTVKAAN